MNSCKYSMPYIRLGNGEPLILIHGLGESKEGWQRQHELSNQFDLIIPDLRGHGENEELSNISIPTFAEDVIRLMNQLGIESAHICGLSMGGAVAQELYRHAPKRVKSLVLASTFHYLPKFLKHLLPAYKRFSSLTPESAAKKCMYSWTSAEYEEFKSIYKPNRQGFELSAEACTQVNNFKLLPNIQVPVLVTGGQYDSVLPVWIQIDMHKRIPHSKLIVYRNTGHVAKLERSAEFNRDIRVFLEEVKYGTTS